MMASNHGEGGVFALGGLLVGNGSLLGARSKFVVTIFMMIGASLVLGDGAFTPSITVIGAVKINKYVIFIVFFILIVLFILQTIKGE